MCSTRERIAIGLVGMCLTTPLTAEAQCPVLPATIGRSHTGWSVIVSRRGHVVSTLGTDAPRLFSDDDGSLLLEFVPSESFYGAGSAVGIADLDSTLIIGDPWGMTAEEGALEGVVRLHSTDDGTQRQTINVGQLESWFGSVVSRSEIDFFVVGAPGYGFVHLDQPELDNRGAAFVYEISWPPPGEASLRHILVGDERHERFGAAVAMLDPLHDPWEPTDPLLRGAVAVGAPRADAGAVDAGRVTVYYAQTGEPNFTASGEAAFDWFGAAVAAAGDVDGDRYNDLIVGAPNHSSKAPHAGRAYIYSGRDGTLLRVIDGEAENDLFGSSVGAVGDVNRDGFDDVLVGAPRHSSRYRNAGRVYVLSGFDGSPLIVLDGRKRDDGFGRSLADTIADWYFVIAAPFARSGASDGAVYVLGGAPLLPGDITLDGVVDDRDLGIVLASFDLTPDDAYYDHNADVDGNGLVDLVDLSMLLANYNQRCTPN
jgi:hypothetical protein